MANICVNRLEIGGAAERLAELRKAYMTLDNGDLYLKYENVIPIPSEILNRRTQISEWTRENWGTTVALDFEILEDSPTKIIARFVSSWTPPYHIIEKMAEVFPDLSVIFDAFDEGSDETYHFESHAGVCQTSEPPLTEERMIFIGGEFTPEDQEKLEKSIAEIANRRKYPPSLWLLWICLALYLVWRAMPLFQR